MLRVPSKRSWRLSRRVASERARAKCGLCAGHAGLKWKLGLPAYISPPSCPPRGGRWVSWACLPAPHLPSCAGSDTHIHTQSEQLGTHLVLILTSYFTCHRGHAVGTITDCSSSNINFYQHPSGPPVDHQLPDSIWPWFSQPSPWIITSSTTIYYIFYYRVEIITHHQQRYIYR